MTATQPAVPSAAWNVGPPEVGEADGWHTWSVDLDGAPLDFSVLGLAPSGRAETALTFAGPLAMANGVDLATEAVVDPSWRVGFDRALEILAPWVDDGGPTPDLLGATEAETPTPRSGRRAMCFTGGVDSFWTLLRGGYDPTDLLYVLGYDYGLGDEDLVAAQVRSVNAVAEALGLRVLLVSTTARRHHRSSPTLWRFHHGAALAAVGMMLSDHVDELVIPASYPDADLIPWGSRPDLDHLWSVPGTLEVVHGHSDKARIDRILEIADEPLVHEHLAVCWERKGPGVNCGRCEKCIRTMFVLAAADVLERVVTFPPVDLPAAIASLAPLPRSTWPFWRRLIDDRAPAHLRVAAIDLLAASGADPDV